MSFMIPGTVPPAFDNGYPQTWNRKWFYFFAIVIQGTLFTLVCMTDNFKIVISLGGAIAGSCIIQIFPAMFYLKIHNWRSDSVYDKVIWLILGLGIGEFIFMFLSLSVILSRIEYLSVSLNILI